MISAAIASLWSVITEVVSWSQDRRSASDNGSTTKMWNLNQATSAARLRIPASRGMLGAQLAVARESGDARARLTVLELLLPDAPDLGSRLRTTMNAALADLSDWRERRGNSRGSGSPCADIDAVARFPNRPDRARRGT